MTGRLAWRYSNSWDLKSGSTSTRQRRESYLEMVRAFETSKPASSDTAPNPSQTFLSIQIDELMGAFLIQPPHPRKIRIVLHGMFCDLENTRA